MKKNHIDMNRCTGHGRCYATAPEIFDCDDEGFPLLLVDTLEEGDPRLESAEVARGNCPESAISFVET